MKYIALLILSVLLLSTSFGIPLNVLNDDPLVDIYVDGIFAGKGNVSNFQVQPGDHFIKVVSGKDVIYSKMITITSEAVKTINTTYFVEAPLTKIANKGSSMIEAARVRDARGNLAMGVYCSDSTVGLSVKYFPLDRFGMQVIGWGSSSPGNANEIFLFRPVYEIGDYVLWDRHMNVYATLGFGQKKVQNSKVDVTTQIQQAAVGVEGTSALLGIPMAIASVVMVAINHNASGTSGLSTEEGMYLLAGVGGLFISVLPNSYVDFELGYEKSVSNDGSFKTGVMFAGAMQFYF